MGNLDSADPAASHLAPRFPDLRYRVETRIPVIRPEKVLVALWLLCLYFVLPLWELHGPEDVMQKTLTKHGNSYALVIDKPILDLLKVTPETPFEVVSDGQSLVLTPIRDPEQERKFQKTLQTLHERFGKTLRKLAE